MTFTFALSWVGCVFRCESKGKGTVNFCVTQGVFVNGERLDASPSPSPSPSPANSPNSGGGAGSSNCCTDLDSSNTVNSEDFATLSGGKNNFVKADFSAVVGGDSNTVKRSSPYGFIGGGSNNYLINRFVTRPV